MNLKRENCAYVLPERQRMKLFPVVLDLFSKNDFHQVSIRQIAKLADISTTTLYRYYTSKENLLFSILNEKLYELSRQIRWHMQGLESTKEMFRKLFWVTLDHYDNNPGLAVTAYITIPTYTWMKEDSYHRKDIYQMVGEIEKQGRKSGEIDKDVTLVQIVDLYFMYCHHFIYQQCYRLKKPRSLVDSMKDFFNIFWKTISVAPKDE